MRPQASLRIVDRRSRWRWCCWSGARSWCAQHVLAARRRSPRYFTTRDRDLPRRRGAGVRGQGRHDRRDRAAGHPDQDDAAASTATCRSPPTPRRCIVAQNLVSARYVQLTPAYREGGGPTMADGAVIPRGPHRGPGRVGRGQDAADPAGNRSGSAAAECRGTSVSRFIDSAANAMDGNGDKLRADLGPAVRRRPDPGRGQRQHRRHHQEPADLRHRAAATATRRSCSSRTGWRR